MAAFDFPPTPAVGTLYPLVAEVGKPQYRWNGSEWTAATFDPAGYVRKSGDAMTGALSLAGDPTQALHAVPKQYLDAQRQRISLAGGKSFDVQVPAGAIMARLTGLIIPTTATAVSLVLQISVAAGVFRSAAGEYTFSGFQNVSNANTVAAAQAGQTVGGMYMGTQTNVLPFVFDGTLSVKRPTTSAYFLADFRSSWFVGASTTHGFYTHYVSLAAVGSALDLLAFRLVSTTGDNWSDGSYLTVEWL